MFSITTHIRKCDCGAVSGIYIDALNATYSGDATLIGFKNTTFLDSLKNVGTDFTAFTIHPDCKTFKSVTKR